MSTAAHTPGPWAHTNNIDEEHFADLESVNGPLYIRASFAPAYGRIPKVEQKRHDEEMLANARLIAAAPCLLAVLIEARAELELYASDSGEDYNNPAMNDAIARATGEQP